MDEVFRSVVRGRSGDGVFVIAGSCFVVVVAIAALMCLRDLYWPPEIATVAMLGGVALAGAGMLFKSVAAFRRKREWELRVDSRALRWYERDVQSERLEGEIFVSDIEEIVYEPSDGVGSLKVHFTDGSWARIPSLHLDSEKKIDEFARYWRAAHGLVPIRNLRSA